MRGCVCKTSVQVWHAWLAESIIPRALRSRYITAWEIQRKKYHQNSRKQVLYGPHAGRDMIHLTSKAKFSSDMAKSLYKRTKHLLFRVKYWDEACTRSEPNTCTALPEFLYCPWPDVWGFNTHTPAMQCKHAMLPDNKYKRHFLHLISHDQVLTPLIVPCQVSNPLGCCCFQAQTPIGNWIHPSSGTEY